MTMRQLVSMVACASLMIAALILAMQTPTLATSDAYVASFAPAGESRYPAVDALVSLTPQPRRVPAPCSTPVLSES